MICVYIYSRNFNTALFLPLRLTRALAEEPKIIKKQKRKTLDTRTHTAFSNTRHTTCFFIFILFYYYRILYCFYSNRSFKGTCTAIYLYYPTLLINILGDKALFKKKKKMSNCCCGEYFMERVSSFSFS